MLFLYIDTNLMYLFDFIIKREVHVVCMGTFLPNEIEILFLQLYDAHTNSLRQRRGGLP